MGFDSMNNMGVESLFTSSHLLVTFALRTIHFPPVAAHEHAAAFAGDLLHRS